MMKGDKIKLKKGIGTLRHIGAICEVTDVSEDGIISFRYKNKYEGCISEDVCMKYFTTLHKWTEWEYGVWTNYSIGNRQPFTFWYRYDGKTVQVKHKEYKAKASCHKNDKFDIDVGLSIAVKRLMIKILTNQIGHQIDIMKLNNFCNQLQMGA